MYLFSKKLDFKSRQWTKDVSFRIKRIFKIQIFIDWEICRGVEKKKEKEAYTTEDPTKTSAKEQEDMAIEAIKKFKSLR